MRQVGVFLAGEGKHELGSRDGSPGYQNDDQPGVLVGLLRCVQAEGWVILGAIQWKAIRKLSAKGPTPNEERNVRALAYEARRAEADIVAFVRDADDDKERPEVIARAIPESAKEFGLKLIGGTAVPVLEGWILALLGVYGTEKLSKAGAQSRLEAKGIRDTAAMVTTVTAEAMSRIPSDATSLTRWLDLAAAVLPALVHRQSPPSPEH